MFVRLYEERSRVLQLPTSPHTKRRLRRGTASTVSDGETPRRDALHDLIAEAEVSLKSYRLDDESLSLCVIVHFLLKNFL